MIVAFLNDSLLTRAISPNALPGPVKEVNDPFINVCKNLVPCNVMTKSSFQICFLHKLYKIHESRLQGLDNTEYTSSHKVNAKHVFTILNLNKSLTTNLNSNSVIKKTTVVSTIITQIIVPIHRCMPTSLANYTKSFP